MKRWRLFLRQWPYGQVVVRNTTCTRCCITELGHHSSSSLLSKSLTLLSEQREFASKDLTQKLFWTRDRKPRTHSATTPPNIHTNVLLSDTLVWHFVTFECVLIVFKALCHYWAWPTRSLFYIVIGWQLYYYILRYERECIHHTRKWYYIGTSLLLHMDLSVHFTHHFITGCVSLLSLLLLGTNERLFPVESALPLRWHQEETPCYDTIEDWTACSVTRQGLKT